MSKETRTHDKGPYYKLLTLLRGGTEACKEKMVVEEMSVDLGFAEGVPSDIAPEFSLRSRRLRSGREF